MANWLAGKLRLTAGFLQKTVHMRMANFAQAA